jgi:hypothetical protein
MESSKELNLYPIDYPFENLASRVKLGKLKLDPVFQRKFKWSNERSSRFIESCLLRIPLPTCYFAEDEKKNHMVIDGVQRITSIVRYFDNEFALEGLDAFSELEGKYFNQLAGDLQNDLENYTIRCIVLRNDNKQELIQDIFARLNQGAVTLTAQEIRHALYPGNLDELLQELGKNETIQNFGQTINSKKEKISLEPEELVLRFFALRGELKDYTDQASKYFDKYMSINKNITKKEVDSLHYLFMNALNNCLTVFGNRAFINASNRKPTQSFIYYDLQMWALQNYDHDFINTNKDKLKLAFYNLCNNQPFKNALSGKILNKSAIMRRRKLWKEEEAKQLGL